MDTVQSKGTEGSEGACGRKPVCLSVTPDPELYSNIHLCFSARLEGVLALLCPYRGNRGKEPRQSEDWALPSPLHQEQTHFYLFYSGALLQRKIARQARTLTTSGVSYSPAALQSESDVTHLSHLIVAFLLLGKPRHRETKPWATSAVISVCLRWQ